MSDHAGVTTRRPALRSFVKANFTSAWLYPFKGIVFWTRNRWLWPLLKSRLIPLAILALGITFLLFFTLYIPQVALLAIFQGKSAWFNATILVLSETNLIVAILFEAWFVDHSQVDCFDAILVHKGLGDLVSAVRQVDESDELGPLVALGQRDKGAIFAPFSFRQIVEFVLVLPLNLIPVVGVPLFLFLTGYRAGPLLQWRYFKLKGFTKADRNAFIKVKDHRWKYTWFGFTALLLQLVPVLSLLFLFTTAAGSALLAADMEEEARRHNQDEDEDLARQDDYTDEP